MSGLESARVAFAGTPEFAVPGLTALIESGAEITCVLTQPDRPAGRGRALTPSPVKQLALAHNLPVRQPAVLDEAFRESLGDDRPDFLVVIAYGLILPQWMLDWPLVAPINVHASLLPRWRGASPIQQAILAGDRQTGVSIMRMAAGLDSGPVYHASSLSIGPEESAGELHDRLAALGAEALAEALPAIRTGQLEPADQDQAAACYAPKISKRDAILDWSQTADQLARQVRAYNPWPVAESRTGQGERLRIWRAAAIAAPSASPPGTVVDTAEGGIDISTGDGLLRILELQPPGGRRMTAAAWLAAHDLNGVRFVGPD